MKLKLIIGIVAILASFEQSAHAQLQWQFAAPMPTARVNVAAAVLDGQIYVIGGEDGFGNALDVVERYDPTTNTWHSAPALRTERAGAAAVVYQNQIFAIGGHKLSDDADQNVLSDVEVFVPSANRWESFAGLEEERDGLTSGVVSGVLFAVGGADDDGRALSSVETYDPIDEEWRIEDDSGDEWHLDIARVSFAAVAISDAAYSFGGFGSFSGPVSQVEKYQVSGGTTILPSFETPRGGLSAVSIGNAVFVMGGRKQDDTVTQRVDIFLTTNNSWEMSAPMNTEREGLASATVSDMVYVFGGLDDKGNVLNSVEQFGPVSVAVQRPELPADFSLGNAHPNPFRTQTSIPLKISAETSSRNVSLVIYDVLGREVRRLVEGTYPVGSHVVIWDGQNEYGQSVAAGTYLYRLSQGAHSASNTLILVR